MLGLYFKYTVKVLRRTYLNIFRIYPLEHCFNQLSERRIVYKLLMIEIVSFLYQLHVFV